MHESFRSKPKIKVLRVKPREFDERVSGFPKYIELYKGESVFHEYPLLNTIPIVNRHASVCLITWVFDTLNQNCISGHFISTGTSVTEGRDREYLKQTIASFTQKSEETPQVFNIKDTWGLRDLHDPTADLFQKFLDKIRPHSNLDQTKEIHMFGQNLLSNIPRNNDIRDINSATHALLANLDVTTRLTTIGFPFSRIHDHRQWSLGSSHTLWDPKQKTLIWSQIDR